MNQQQPLSSELIEFRLIPITDTADFDVGTGNYMYINNLYNLYQSIDFWQMLMK